MNQVLMQAVVDLAVFVGASSDDIVEPDASVTALEKLVATLRALPARERDALVAFVGRSADESRNAERASFLRDLAEQLLAIDAPDPVDVTGRPFTLPFSSVRVIAIDWSGAIAGERTKIWIAEVCEGQVARLECGRTRDEVVSWLIGERARGGQAIVGLDFAFSTPEWYLDEREWTSASLLWSAMAGEAEHLLRACDPPFWGRQGRTLPKDGRAQFRRTEASLTSVGGIRPKSVFQINGGGAVGTGSLRGMPALHRLSSAGFAVWPFTAAGDWTVVEIYPRLLTGPVTKSNARARLTYLRDRTTLSSKLLDDAASSEDAFDAVVSALAMAERIDELTTLSIDGLDRTARREGLIWAPRAAKT